ncbi:MAG: EamA family transporter [Neomegalonema sp.]|nr:EamA family transporter [Neomegalonema sp.]
MALWIPITLAAAFLQNLRSSLQAGLRGRVGPTGATFVRFAYALPFTFSFFAIALYIDGAPPPPSWIWAGWTGLGGAAQILATAALLAAVPKSGFAIATGYSKTEPILAALAGALLLLDVPPLLAALAIVVGVVGVWLATVQHSAAGWSQAFGAGLGYGLAAAALFALSAVSYRGASLSLESGSVAIRAAFTLATATAAQTIVMLVWMAARAPAEIRAVAAAWRPGLLTGAAGAFASLGWFTAMTLEPAAHVRALAQVELLFAATTAWIWFGERQSRRAILGLALIGAGAAMLLFATA